MEGCVPPDEKVNPNALYVVAEDDSILLGLFESCVLKDAAKKKCLQTLVEKGVLRPDGK